MTHSRVARRYAAALMAVADQGKTAEAIARDLQMILATLKGSRELRLLIASPIVRGGKKASVFKALFASRVSVHTMAFIDLLIAKQREGILAEAIEQYMKLRDIQMGIENIAVVSAVELAKKQEDALRAQMERLTGKKVRLHLSLNPGIRGGIIVRVGDTVLDASINHQLEILGERFARGEFATAQATA
jgi:F-type H+-transporting ATPase subunit delta